jgi:hypothetical protein
VQGSDLRGNRELFCCRTAAFHICASPAGAQSSRSLPVFVQYHSLLTTLSACVHVCLCTGGLSGAQIVDNTLRQAAARGLNTVRTLAHTRNSVYPFQVGRTCMRQQLDALAHHRSAVA